MAFCCDDSRALPPPQRWWMVGKTKPRLRLVLGSLKVGTLQKLLPSSLSSCGGCGNLQVVCARVHFKTPELQLPRGKRKELCTQLLILIRVKMRPAPTGEAGKTLHSQWVKKGRGRFILLPLCLSHKKI